MPSTNVFMIRKRLILLSIVAFFGGGLCSSEVRAQLTSGLEQTYRQYQPASVYRFAETGDITITVNVWGAVQKPGLYEVPKGTRLSKLFSLAGGPAIAERRSRERHTTTLRLVREAEHHGVVFESIMENEILVSNEDPILEEGDVMTVEVLVRQRFSLRDVFPIVAAIGSVALAIERLSAR